MRFGSGQLLSVGAALLIAGTGLLATLPAAAQGLPPGSYQRSCANFRIYEGTLVADCQRRDQSWHHTDMPRFWECHADIANIDGHLRCMVAEERPRLPPGSYMQSCWDAHVAEGVLYAQCRRFDGGAHATELPEAWHCRADIENENGHLRCRGW